MNTGIILLAISILPVVLIALFIYNNESNKEPLKLIMKLFFGGVGSCFLTLIVSSILSVLFPFIFNEYRTGNLFQILVYTFIGVALIEESSKWSIACLIAYNNKEFDELYDMIIYCVFVSLGFACFENLLYVFEGGLSTGFLRALLSVPGHACDGVFMGYYMGLAKINSLNNRKKHETRYLILSIVVPTILHGIYDYCLFSNVYVLIVFFYIFVIVMYIFTIKKINKISSLSKTYDKITVCNNCGNEVKEIFCTKCGKKRG